MLDVCTSVFGGGLDEPLRADTSRVWGKKKVGGLSRWVLLDPISQCSACEMVPCSAAVHRIRFVTEYSSRLLRRFSEIEMRSALEMGDYTIDRGFPCIVARIVQPNKDRARVLVAAVLPIKQGDSFPSIGALARTVTS